MKLSHSVKQEFSGPFGKQGKMKKEQPQQQQQQKTPRRQQQVLQDTYW